MKSIKAVLSVLVLSGSFLLATQSFAQAPVTPAKQPVSQTQCMSGKNHTGCQRQHNKSHQAQANNCKKMHKQHQNANKSASKNEMQKQHMHQQNTQAK